MKAKDIAIEAFNNRTDPNFVDSLEFRIKELVRQRSKEAYEQGGFMNDFKQRGLDDDLMPKTLFEILNEDYLT